MSNNLKEYENRSFKGNISQHSSRKWFITINNPNENLEDFLGFKPWTENAEQDIKNWKKWIKDNLNPEYFAFSFEYGLEENHTAHMHIYITKKSPWRGSTLMKKFNKKANLQPADKTHQANRNYVFKESLSDANAEKINERIEGRQFESGEVPPEKYNVGNSKKKEKVSDMVLIKGMIIKGMTPSQILDKNPDYYFYKKEIKEMFFDKREKETPIHRDINVVLHCGVAGSGKTYVLTQLDREELFVATDYSAQGTALFDNYEAQKIVYMDEFRGQIPYNRLLVILNGYNMPEHARYNNVRNVWDTVHISSVVPPEMWYKNLYEEDKYDSYEQLHRRMSTVVYHCMTYYGVLIKDKMEFLATHDKSEIKYHEYAVNAACYTSYEDLEKEALAYYGIKRPEEVNFLNLYKSYERQEQEKRMHLRAVRRRNETQYSLLDFLNDDDLPWSS